MNDPKADRDLFGVLRQLAIVSAALGHNPTNREELLAQRESLVRAAEQMGFAVSEDQQERLNERLESDVVIERPSVRGTTNHTEILAWALEHDAVPAEVRRPIFDHQPSALRFLSGEAKAGTPELKVISWAAFFAQFELMGLAAVFNEDAECELIQAVPSPVRPPN